MTVLEVLRSEKNRQVRRANIKVMKTYMAAHYWHTVSKDPVEIAQSVNVGLSKFKEMQRSERWTEALIYWGYETTGDSETHKEIGKKISKALQTPSIDPKEREQTKAFRAVSQLWGYMLKDGYDLFPDAEHMHKRLAFWYKDREPDQIGLESYTLLDRAVDFIKTMPYRVRSAFWALYVSLFL